MIRNQLRRRRILLEILRRDLAGEQQVPPELLLHAREDGQAVCDGHGGLAHGADDEARPRLVRLVGAASLPREVLLREVEVGLAVEARGFLLRAERRPEVDAVVLAARLE